jgi:hypothetical protein
MGLTLTRSLGFVVIGRLAGRHDVSVRVTPSPSGGVTALVTFPAALLSPGAAEPVAAGPAGLPGRRPARSGADDIVDLTDLPVLEALPAPAAEDEAWPAAPVQPAANTNGHHPGVAPADIGPVPPPVTGLPQRSRRGEPEPDQLPDLPTGPLVSPGPVAWPGPAAPADAPALPTSPPGPPGPPAFPPAGPSTPPSERPAASAAPAAPAPPAPAGPVPSAPWAPTPMAPPQAPVTPPPPVAPVAGPPAGFAPPGPPPAPPRTGPHAADGGESFTYYDVEDGYVSAQRAAVVEPPSRPERTPTATNGSAPPPSPVPAPTAGPAAGPAAAPPAPASAEAAIQLPTDPVGKDGQVPSGLGDADAAAATARPSGDDARDDARNDARNDRSPQPARPAGGTGVGGHRPVRPGGDRADDDSVDAPAAFDEPAAAAPTSMFGLPSTTEERRARPDRPADAPAPTPAEPLVSAAPVAASEELSRTAAASGPFTPNTASLPSRGLTATGSSELTAAGLARRSPKQQLRSLASQPTGNAAPRVVSSQRSPEEVRRMLSRYRTGLQRGRAVTSTDDGPEAPDDAVDAGRGDPHPTRAEDQAWRP